MLSNDLIICRFMDVVECNHESLTAAWNQNKTLKKNFFLVKSGLWDCEKQICIFLDELFVTCQLSLKTINLLLYKFMLKTI